MEGNDMNFTNGMTEMFLLRFEVGGCLAQLQKNDTYRMAVSEFQDARKAAEGETVSREAVDRLTTAFGRLASLEAQYLYRAGMQDGLSMTRPDFLTADLVY